MTEKYPSEGDLEVLKKLGLLPPATQTNKDKKEEE
jgi:hypothetical protein